MSLFARPHYTSVATEFLDGLKEKNPALDAQQLAGRALLWDKEVNYEVQADSNKARVPQKPYVYSNL